MKQELGAIDYNKFGSKTQQIYGNNIITDFMYNTENLRLTQQKSYVQGAAIGINPNGGHIYGPPTRYLDITYTYDDKGNITGMNTVNKLPKFSSNQIFAYDSADQLITASGNNGSLYNLTMSYANYGRINSSNTTFTDPQNNTVTQQFNNNYTYNTTNAPANSFAPVSGNDTIIFKFGINGSMRKRITPQKTEYYLFNAFDQLKAYSDNSEVYGYYGYDDAGQRMYKAVLNYSEVRTNIYGDRTLEVEKIMLYPNGYINITQDGNYTKHYYADAARIASKIGSGCDSTISSKTDSIQNVVANKTMLKELTELTGDTVAYIDYNFAPITHLIGDSNKYEGAAFWYHGSNIASTMLVTDMGASVTQAVMYLPFGTVLSEWKNDWELDTILPKFLFNAKEYDEENKMYYYGARYYSDEDMVYRGRDKHFEKVPYMSPYAQCNNNSINLIDPDGNFPIPWPSKGVGMFSVKGNIGIGLGFGVGANANRGMAIDKHGMTHFTTYSTTYIANQKVQDESRDFSFITGGGGSVGVEASYDFSANSFIEALNNFSASGTASGKFGVGGSVGAGESSFSIGAGIGFEIGLNGGAGSIKIKESISLSRGESDKAGQFSQWSVVPSMLKQDKDGNPYFSGTVMSRGLFGKERNTGIGVTCPAVKTDKGYVPSGIWTSKEYQNSVNADK